MPDQQRWEAVDRYVEELLIPDDPKLEAALDANAAAGLPPHDVSPAQGKFLSLLVKIAGARSVLEIGALGGYLASGTVIVGDNVVREGPVIDSEDEPRVQGVRGFHELLAAEERLDAPTNQTVGVKGYDGFSIVIVDGDR